MRAISNLFSAVTNLAASVDALAGVLDMATGRLRQSLALDEPPALSRAEAFDAVGPVATKRNGKAKAAAYGKEQRQSPPEGPAKYSRSVARSLARIIRSLLTGESV
jgi:hypothetical protein